MHPRRRACRRRGNRRQTDPGRPAGRRHIVGQTIAITYRASWDHIGIDHSVWAPVYDDGLREGVDEFDVAGLVSSKVEVEVVLSFERPVPVGAGRQQIASAVGWAALGYEIVDCHYPGWALTPPDMVADFGCHAALVIGTRRRTTVEEVLALSDLTITLWCDGEDVATGSGTDVLGGPVDAVCAVAREPRDGADSRGRRDHDGRTDSEGPASDRGTCWTAQAQASLSFDPITVRLK